MELTWATWMENQVALGRSSFPVLSTFAHFTPFFFRVVTSGHGVVSSYSKHTIYKLYPSYATAEAHATSSVSWFTWRWNTNGATPNHHPFSRSISHLKPSIYRGFPLMESLIRPAGGCLWCNGWVVVTRRSGCTRIAPENWIHNWHLWWV